MARTKRLQKYNSGAADTPVTPRSRRVPVILTCPVCQTLLGDVPADVHLQHHMPPTICTHCEATEPGWRLDMDSIAYPKAGQPIYFCRNCGRYASEPVTA